MKLIAQNVDITTLKVDAIVNAANPVMRGGSGVDGAIHKAAGPDLAITCENEHSYGCPTGQVRLTPGFNLPAKYVIHTVGPDMREIDFDDLGDELLASCYRQAMKMAVERGFKSIAFPSISTGVYGFDKDRAVQIAYGEVIKFGEHDIEVTFACFGEDDTNLYNKFFITASYFDEQTGLGSVTVAVDTSNSISKEKLIELVPELIMDDADSKGEGE